MEVKYKKSSSQNQGKEVTQTYTQSKSPNYSNQSEVKSSNYKNKENLQQRSESSTPKGTFF